MLSCNNVDGTGKGDGALIDAAVLSASDRSSLGLRDDIGGELLQELLKEIPARLAGYRVVPDQVRDIRAALRSLARRPGMKLVLTTGGTGVSPRDVTPEATEALLERDLPALGLAMRWASYPLAPASLISRSVAGYHRDCLIVNLPGSPKAVRECFEVLLPLLRWLFAAPGKRKE